MRLRVHVEGFKEVQRAIERLGDAKVVGRVVSLSWRESARSVVKPEIRKHVRSRFRGKRALAASYSARVFGNRISNIRMDVYSRVDAAISHEYGPRYPIIAKSGKYLTIPTKFASRKIGSNKQFSGLSRNKRVRLSQLIKADKRAKTNSLFVIDKGGKKIVMQKTNVGGKRGKALRRQIGKRNKDAAVPVFVLQRVVIPKRITRVRETFRQRPRREVVRRTTVALIKEYMKK